MHYFCSEMETAISRKKIWTIAYPIIIGGIAQNIVLATDTAFLGRLGEVALGAAALGGLYYYIAVFVANGIGVGAQIIMSRRFGEKQYTQIGPVLSQSGLIMVVLNILLFLLLFFLSGAFFRATIDSHEVQQATTLFLHYRSWGIFLAGVNVLMRAFFISIHRTRVITYSTVVMGVLNIVLDYGLIFGRLGLPEMGIAGAALASVIAEATASVFLLTYLVTKIPSKRYNLSFRFVPEKARLFRILNISGPVMLQNFFSMVGWFIFFLFVEHLGSTQLAVSNIVRSIYMIILIPVFGFSSAAATLVSFLIGKGDNDEVLPMIRKVVTMVFLSTLLILIPVNIFRDSLLAIYTNNAALIAMAHGPLNIISGSALILGVGFTLFFGVSGTGNTHVSLLIEGSVLVVYLIFTRLFVYTFHFDVTHVWISEYIYALLMVILSFAYLKWGHWSKKVF